MEEKILEIIEHCYKSDWWERKEGDDWIETKVETFDDIKAAKEITTHVMKFTLWLVLVFECDLLKESQHSPESDKEMIERLYEYWLKNVEK
jgi:hypothetical protein